MPPNGGTNINGSLLLEEPLIRTPYELLRRTHRTAQRQVEKDFIGVQSVLSNLLKSFDDRPLSEDARIAVAGKLDQAGDRIRGLKRKLDDLQPSEKAPTPLRTRLKYLDGIIQSGGTARQLEIKVEPVENGDSNGAEVKVEVRAVVLESESRTGNDQFVDQDGGAGNAMKTEMEVEIKDEKMEVEEERHERAISPVAPEPVMEDTTLDRYIVDYLLRTGRQKSAKALAEKRSIEPLVDLKLFAELNKIETALMEKKSVAEALAWCGENRGTLKKTKNNLEFILRLQEFIELCRRRDTIGAIAYSRKNLASWAASHMLELQQGMTLLAFGEKTGVGLYRKLYDPSRWTLVRDQFRETFLSLYALPSQPLLSLALSAGLSSLRLPSCIQVATTPKAPEPILLPSSPPLHNIDTVSAVIRATFPQTVTSIQSQPETNTTEQANDPPIGNIDCPTCSEDIKVLASEVPMSHHVNSTIVCRISGLVMDSQNEPMAFPNGRVYSQKALAEMAANNFDVVKCPRTGESCASSRLRKVYIS